MTIRDVPESSRDKLAQRASESGQSLQVYMRNLVIEAADRQTIDEWLDEARSAVRGSGVRLPAEDYVAAVRSARGEID